MSITIRRIIRCESWTSLHIDEQCRVNLVTRSEVQHTPSICREDVLNAGLPRLQTGFERVQVDCTQTMDSCTSRFLVRDREKRSQK